MSKRTPSFPRLPCHAALSAVLFLPQTEPAFERARAIVAEVRQEPPVERRFDVLHYLVRARIDCDPLRVEGRVTLRVRPGTSVANATAGTADSTPSAGLPPLRLDAVGLEIRSVSDAEGSPLEFAVDSLGVAVQVATLWTDQELFEGAKDSESLDHAARALAREITVEYSAAPADGLLPSDADDTSLRGVFTHHACQSARRWIPCVDAPDDRATFEFELTVDAKQRTVASGALDASTDHEDGTRTDHWRCAVEIPTYSAAVYVGDLASVALGTVGTVRLLAEVPSSARELALSTLQSTGNILENLQDLLGVAYPASEYRQVLIPELPVGGMENFGCTALRTDRCFEASQRCDHPLSIDSLIAHELAHQWWGDRITPHTWKDAWISEGFASYIDLLCLERRHGREEFLATWIDVQDSCLEKRAKHGRPLVCDTYASPCERFDANIYEGGSTFLHLLRSKVGDARFLTALPEITRALIDRSVTSADVQAAFARVLGVEVEPLFDEWLHASRLPALELDWNYRRERRQVQLIVRQVQTGADVPEVFHLPLRVALQVGEMRQEITLDLDDRVTRRAIDCAEAPQFVRFNVENALTAFLAVEQPVRAWHSQLLFDTDPTGRVQALRALARIKPGTGEGEREEFHRTAALVSRALLEDPWFKVRVEAARSLATLQTSTAGTALSAALHDEDPRVRMAAADALAVAGERALGSQKLLQRLAIEDRASVRSALLRALALSGGMDAASTLRGVVGSESRSTLERGQALRSLVAIDPASAAPLVQSFCARNAALWQRQAGLQAAALLCGSGPQWSSVLREALGDPVLLIRVTAVEALRAVAAPTALPMLVETFDASDSDLLRSRVREVLRQLLEPIPPR